MLGRFLQENTPSHTPKALVSFTTQQCLAFFFVWSHWLLYVDEIAKDHHVNNDATLRTASLRRHAQIHSRAAKMVTSSLVRLQRRVESMVAPLKCSRVDLPRRRCHGDIAVKSQTRATSCHTLHQHTVHNPPQNAHIKPNRTVSPCVPITEP